jgi:tRNA threonylcarbamoyladenosine biosynthesis protein TsaE
MIHVTDTIEETYALAESLAGTIKPGQFIALRGDLGSGKTTFTKGFAKGLGITKHITSPTFLIIKTYEVSRDDIRKLYHLDLYRLRSEKEIEEIGIAEIINDPFGVVIVEWAERMGNLLPKERIDINLEYIDERKRKITIEKNK